MEHSSKSTNSFSLSTDSTTSSNYSHSTNTLHYKKVKEGATTMMEEIDKGMDQLKEQYIEPYVNQRRPSKGQQIKTVDGCEQKSIFRIMK